MIQRILVALLLIAALIIFILGYDNWLKGVIIDCYTHNLPLPEQCKDVLW